MKHYFISNISKRFFKGIEWLRATADLLTYVGIVKHLFWPCSPNFPTVLQNF